MMYDGNSSNGIKRIRKDSESDSESDENYKKNEWPRFLVISPTNDDQSLGKLSPFAIAKAMKGLAGEPKDIKVLQSGKILVECSKKQHSDNLLKTQMFVNIPVTVSPHQSLNFSKGVVRSRDLRNCSETEMLENLKDQNVVEVKRIHITRNGTKILTNTFILKFNVSSIPTHVKAGFLNIPVEPFVPNPLRCFNCQRFGHHKDKCKKTSVCARCGQEGHDFSSCENPVQCSNCKGDHFAHSRECAKWKQEREIQIVKVKEKISFQDARKKVLARGGFDPLAPSYADVVRSPPVETKSVAIQTEITWPKNKKCSYLDGSVVSFDDDKSRSQDTAAETNKTGLSQSSKKGRNKKGQTNVEKLPKGQRDPIQVHNKYGGLDEDMELEEASDKPLPVSPKCKKKIVKVQPP